MFLMVVLGVKLKDVFDSMMDVIKKVGLLYYYCGYFGYGDGVFLGLEEVFFVSILVMEIFWSGMVLSLEIFYYGIGIGLIMLEDMIFIINDGYEFLSKLDCDLC